MVDVVDAVVVAPGAVEGVVSGDVGAADVAADGVDVDVVLVLVVSSVVVVVDVVTSASGSKPTPESDTEKSSSSDWLDVSLTVKFDESLNGPVEPGEKE